MSLLIQILLVLALIGLQPAFAKSGHKSYSYQGGHYTGGKGSSHKGGKYENPKTGNHYTHPKG